MNREWVITQGAFDVLLAWLDSDRLRAGEKYEMIRRRLIKIFTCRGCTEAEGLADMTIDRVAKRVGEIAPTYSGDPALYFYGVANNVHLEYLRRKQPQPLPSTMSYEPQTDIEREYQCLEKCMGHLTPSNRELVLQYYTAEKRAKIDHRKHLAEQAGVALSALRLRAFRIRQTLQECVLRCFQQYQAMEIG